MNYTEALYQMAKVHEAKSHDYAKEDNKYSNFEFAAMIADEFPDGPDKVFAAIVGIKLARLAELFKNNKTPQNESIEDSFLDLCNYGVLWWTWRSQSQKEETDGYGWGI